MLRNITLPGQSEGSAVINGGKVFVFLTDGKLYVVDPIGGTSTLLIDTGRSVWRSMPTVVDDIIYVGADKYFMGVTTTGSINVSKELGNALFSPIASGNRFYIGSNDENLYALNQFGDIAWKFKAGDAIRTTPLVVNKTIYIGSNDKSVYALDADTGAVKWSKKLDDWPSSLLYSNGTVFTTTLNGTVTAISTISCRISFPENNATIFARASLAGQAYADAGVAKVEIKAVPNEFQNTNGLEEWNTVLPIIGGSEGPISIQCRATDKAGNVEIEPYTESVYNFVFSEEKLPKINVTIPQSVTVKSPFTLQFKDISGKPLTNFSVTIEGVKYPVSDPNGLFTFTPTREGPLSLFIEKANYQTKTISTQVQQQSSLPLYVSAAVVILLLVYIFYFRKGRWR